MPVNSRGQRVNKSKMNSQRAQAHALRKPKKSTGGTSGGASVGGGT